MIRVYLVTTTLRRFELAALNLADAFEQAGGIIITICEEIVDIK